MFWDVGFSFVLKVIFSLVLHVTSLKVYDFVNSMIFMYFHRFPIRLLANYELMNSQRCELRDPFFVDFHSQVLVLCIKVTAQPADQRQFNDLLFLFNAFL